jgi:hypothetical protein
MKTVPILLGFDHTHQIGTATFDETKMLPGYWVLSLGYRMIAEDEQGPLKMDIRSLGMIPESMVIGGRSADDGETLWIPVSREILPQLGEWSAPVQVKVVDGKLELRAVSPAPSCATCRFAETRGLCATKADPRTSFLICTKEPMNIGGMEGGHCDAGHWLEVEPDFGCVEWEQKP